MPLPAGWTTRDIKGAYMDVAGNPAKGKVTFTPRTSRIKDATSDVILFAGPVSVELDEQGEFTATLPVSTGDADVTPWFQYEVLEELAGTAAYKYTIEIDILLPEGTVFDISDLIVIPLGSAVGTTALTREVADEIYSTTNIVTVPLSEPTPDEPDGTIVVRYDPA